jgi:UDP-N-acetylmuramoyl-L-alanyl-D-glutamate--2,6-diaminopimelate ligase
MTMPGRFFLQRLLYDAWRAGKRYAVLEVTSQGVLQHRHRWIHWDVCVFTNLAPEHVEAHGSFEAYRAAKVAFFAYAARRNRDAVFIVNKDDANAPYFVRAIFGRRVMFFGPETAPLTLVGDFNDYNAGAALAACGAVGVPESEARAALASFPGVRGRMEYLQRDPFAVIVDYAVTPDSLAAAYNAVRALHPQGALIGVFGCTGGGRDAWKRGVMGELAARACDYVVLTDDDSYDEDANAIMAAIEAGMHKARPAWELGRHYWKVVDRKAAIAQGIRLAKPGDTVLITGKGGDRWLRMAHGKKIPWSDQAAVRDILQNSADSL